MGHLCPSVFFAEIYKNMLTLLFVCGILCIRNTEQYRIERYEVRVMRWNVVTIKNGVRKNHFFTIRNRTDVNAYDIAAMFSYKYNGTEGEVLEIIPLED